MIWDATMAKLGPEAALIFRITHVNNVPWILKHGIHCQTSDTVDPGFVPIGSAELIDKRLTRLVPIEPGGSLADYVPFYFTPHSVMMFNIKTGYNGVIRRPNDEIAIVVSSLYKLKETQTTFVYTNAHAYMQEAEFYADLADLDKVDWKLLQNRDFKKDPEDPGKLGRYQAEMLVHRAVPVDAILGIACYDEVTKAKLEGQVRGERLEIPVKAMPKWYF